jgi:hypothetical protein
MNSAAAATITATTAVASVPENGSTALHALGLGLGARAGSTAHLLSAEVINLRHLAELTRAVALQNTARLPQQNFNGRGPRWFLDLLFVDNYGRSTLDPSTDVGSALVSLGEAVERKHAELADARESVLARLLGLLFFLLALSCARGCG